MRAKNLSWTWAISRNTFNVGRHLLEWGEQQRFRSFSRVVFELYGLNINRLGDSNHLVSEGFFAQCFVGKADKSVGTHMQKILLIEDQLDAQLIVKALLGHRYQLILASTLGEALQSVEGQEFDLVLLDVQLPDGNGFEFFSQLRGLPQMKDVPIVFLTSKSEVNDKVAAFSLGAEDYIVKPFEPLEFRARVEARLAARLSRMQAREVLRKGRLELDRAMFKAFARDGAKPRDLELTPHEFRLLTYFLQHEGIALTREQLMTAVWGGDIHVLERTIDRHISSLRRKLDAKFEKLEPVHGLGYRFSLVAQAGSGAKKDAA